MPALAESLLSSTSVSTLLLIFFQSSFLPLPFFSPPSALVLFLYPSSISPTFNLLAILNAIQIRIPTLISPIPPSNLFSLQALPIPFPSSTSPSSLFQVHFHFLTPFHLFHFHKNSLFIHFFTFLNLYSSLNFIFFQSSPSSASHVFPLSPLSNTHLLPLIIFLLFQTSSFSTCHPYSRFFLSRRSFFYFLCKRFRDHI